MRAESEIRNPVCKQITQLPFTFSISPTAEKAMQLLLTKFLSLAKITFALLLARQVRRGESNNEEWKRFFCNTFLSNQNQTELKRIIGFSNAILTV